MTSLFVATGMGGAGVVGLLAADGVGALVVVLVVCLLARRIRQLSEEVRELEVRLTRLVERHAPRLLEVVGIGPDTAVTLLTTIGDNPERLGSEVSFAALCGVSPVGRSPGSRQYRRLNRGGDRQANAALHRVVQTRLRVDPRRQNYYERRSKEGKTRREIVRSLKRYAAREVFHLVRPMQSRPSSQGQCDSACERGVRRASPCRRGRRGPPSGCAATPAVAPRPPGSPPAST